MFLSSIAMVQLRPGMYVGDVHDGAGLRNLVDGPLDRAVAQILSGAGTRVELRLRSDGAVAVTDDCSAMPLVAPTGSWDVPYPELVLTDTRADCTMIPSTRVTCGLTPVNALSDWLELHTWRQQTEHFLRFEAGELAQPLTRIAKSSGFQTAQGTQISFLPRAAVFDSIALDRDLIAIKLKEIKERTGVQVVLIDDRQPGAPVSAAPNLR